MKVVLEFGGGLELLFDKVKKMELDIPVAADPSGAAEAGAGAGAGAADADAAPALPAVEAPLTVGKLLVWVRDNLLKERPELFMAGDTLCVLGLWRGVGVVVLTLRVFFPVAQETRRAVPHQRRGLGVGRQTGLQGARTRQHRVHFDVARRLSVGRPQQCLICSVAHPVQHL